MTIAPSADFDIGALYDALDAQRRARGLTWSQAAQEIGGQFDRSRATPISPSTLTGLRRRRVVEGDGVLQMLRWLHRTPESFVPGGSDDGAQLPTLPPHRILRFDTKAIYAALDAERTSRGLTWTAVAREIGGTNAASLTRLADGGRTAFPPIARIARWLGRTVASLTRASDR